MKNNAIINYRGAKATVAELQPRVNQMQQQHGAQMVSYRGAQAETDLHPAHQKAVKELEYRGANAQFEVEL